MTLESEEDLVLLLANAVDQWFRYYAVEHDDRVRDVLCNAGLDFYKAGYRSEDDLATLLIGTFVGLASTKINTPASATVH
ncbi:hypothetical protein ELI02_33840 [Rhizobium leguminosarum]|uniref:Uncharacterized protein n=1 Tax=Rhizobium leguminosarum TaxID=384 RepID=A0A4Q8XPK0_RHILE|nr:hypothetical protein [Rhizobium leguminosarum]TAX22738.1 hypothetical protein ELI04_32550 [Rhizobium leguminosarum]TAX43382.1 hypothetical protein ELI02_33840 [Rhizobium leguminosarum]TAX46533.1 hypothetical protein ELI01_30595 [Rhizobium leguminosarum]TAX64432.1 hypothetical protein ELI03_34845 [Rhizobium leguminosarum]TAY05759.1 hypothetical protein ELH91_30470 [Rhizobium leguminosarum]